MQCYCCSGLPFDQCCKPIVQGDSYAKTPEELMRSRYSAFCTNNACYLVATHWPVDPDSRPQIQKTIDETHWLGLKVIRTDTAKTQLKGSVEFAAFFEEQGVRQLHEKSNFEHRDGKWFYLTGEHLPPIKLGRNEPCFCGSEKKYKKCHGH